MYDLIGHMDNSTFLVIIGIFIGTLSLQLYYVLFIFRKLAMFRPSEVNKVEIPISVIIASRNGGEELLKSLPIILNQEYSNYEVIVVNNNSVDNSSKILADFESKYPHLKVIELGNGKHLRPGKKLPLTVGIKGAANEHLLFTDVDCIPNSNQWIKQMAQSFSAHKEIVLGYGPYHKRKGIINKIIRFDCAWIAINYFSYALYKIPYMGVGRNLAYTKTAFYSVDGYKSHCSLSSGDDDLFVQEAANKSNLAIQIDPQSYCFSEAKINWTDWIYQKSRHYTTAPKYSFIKKLLLAIYPVSLISAWICFVSLMVIAKHICLCILLMSTFYAVKWWIQGRCLLKLKEKRFAVFFPFWDLFYALLIPMVYVLAINKQNYKW